MDSAVARVLDANLNRAREALRVLEDHARFALDDPAAALRVKTARHRLTELAALLPPAELLHARDVAGDVGADLSTPAEITRDSPAAVAAAAAKRASEALRCLEEYGKLLSADFARGVERLRYDIYGIEQGLFGPSPPRARIRSARLHVLLTESLCARPWLDVAAAALEGGADVVQLREKTLPDRELLARARALVERARRRRAAVVINDRPDIARLAGADGVHLGQDDLSVRDARRVAGPTVAVGLSTHSVEEVRAALSDPPDYLAVGPMFASDTKPQATVAGPTLAAEAMRLTDLPLVAIGGITPQRVGELAHVGVRCVAVCQAVIAAADPAAACRALLAGLPQR